MRWLRGFGRARGGLIGLHGKASLSGGRWNGWTYWFGRFSLPVAMSFIGSEMLIGVVAVCTSHYRKDSCPDASERIVERAACVSYPISVFENGHFG